LYHQHFCNFAQNIKYHGRKRRNEIIEGALAGSEEVPLTSIAVEPIFWKTNKKR
jgi:hypothetical protein